MQSGQLFKRNGAWHLRFYQMEIVDGQPVRKRISKRIAPIDDLHRSQKDVWPLVEEILSPLNRGALPSSSMAFGDFFENVFLPHVKAKRKASTHKFYKDAFRFHLKKMVGDIPLRGFTTAHAQRVLDEIPISHQSLLRIKTAMSAAFTVARQKDFIRTANPVVGSKAEGYKTDFKPSAYTLGEIVEMLGKLEEPARTVIAVAAFSGLREGEIRGLRWEDFDGESLHVRRSIWRTHVGETKTEGSAATVPVIPFLQKILVAHQERAVGNGYIFAGAKMRFSLNLDNLCAREIRPKIGAAWKGWHGFRRGLATNLFELGVPPKVAQGILRHSDVATTAKHYIVLENRRAGDKALRKLEKAVKRATDGQQKKLVEFPPPTKAA